LKKEKELDLTILLIKHRETYCLWLWTINYNDWSFKFIKFVVYLIFYIYQLLHLLNKAIDAKEKYFKLSDARTTSDSQANAPAVAGRENTDTRW